jgi:hypothetical protein
MHTVKIFPAGREFSWRYLGSGMPLVSRPNSIALTPG